MKCGSTRTKTYGMPGAYLCCKCFFEITDLRSRSKPIRSQYIDDGLDVALIERLAAVWEWRTAKGSSPVDGKYFAAERRHTHFSFLNSLLYGRLLTAPRQGYRDMHFRGDEILQFAVTEPM